MPVMSVPILTARMRLCSTIVLNPQQLFLVSFVQPKCRSQAAIWIKKNPNKTVLLASRDSISSKNYCSQTVAAQTIMSFLYMIFFSKPTGRVWILSKFICFAFHCLAENPQLTWRIFLHICQTVLVSSTPLSSSLYITSAPHLSVPDSFDLGRNLSHRSSAGWEEARLLCFTECWGSDRIEQCPGDSLLLKLAALTRTSLHASYSSDGESVGALAALTSGSFIFVFLLLRQNIVFKSAINIFSSQISFLVYLNYSPYAQNLTLPELSLLYLPNLKLTKATIPYSPNTSWPLHLPDLTKLSGSPTNLHTYSVISTWIRLLSLYMSFLHNSSCRQKDLLLFSTFKLISFGDHVKLNIPLCKYYILVC